MSDVTQSPTPLLRVIDLETTGDGPAHGGVVEIGWQDLVPDAAGLWALRGGPVAQLVRPGCPISAVTSAIHHIVDEDVVEAPAWADVAPGILQGRAPVALAAHCAAFEKRWCPPALTGRRQWICTYKCALRIWPEAPSHSNQGLRYWRRPSGLDRATGLPAHRAGPDAYVTAHHLRDMLAVASVEQLVAWSAEPALLVRVPNGALRGRRWQDLDEAQPRPGPGWHVRMEPGHGVQRPGGASPSRQGTQHLGTTDGPSVLRWFEGAGRHAMPDYRSRTASSIVAASRPTSSCKLAAFKGGL